MIGWWWAAFLVLNFTLNAYSLQGGDGYDLAEVKAFNAIAGIGEVIGLLVSLAAGTLWAAIVLRIERNQAALLTEIFPPTHPHACTRTMELVTGGSGVERWTISTPPWREFKCLLTRAFATLYTSKVGSKVDHEHAAGAAAKGTFATSRRRGASKVQKLPS